jgi:hypothetical protein
MLEPLVSWGRGASDHEVMRPHVRSGFTRLDAGEIDEFDLDNVIHHYTRSATQLWKFCGSSGGQWQHAAHTLRYLREHGEEPDWWERGAPRRGSR